MFKSILRSLAIAIAIAIMAPLSAFAITDEVPTCASVSGSFSGECTVDASRYVVTIKSALLMKRADDSNISFVDTDADEQSFDISSASVGAALADYASGYQPPAGTYVGIALTLSKTATLRASIDNGSLSCRTTSSGATFEPVTASDYIIPSAFTDITSGSFASYNYSSADDFEMWRDGSDDLVIVAKFPPGQEVVVRDGTAANVQIRVNFGTVDSALFVYSSGFCGGAYLYYPQAEVTLSVGS